MNEAASSVEPEVKTRFAAVDDTAFERPQMQFPVFNNIIIANTDNGHTR
jgi:hypothetical protein